MFQRLPLIFIKLYVIVINKPSAPHLEAVMVSTVRIFVAALLGFGRSAWLVQHSSHLYRKRKDVHQAATGAILYMVLTIVACVANLPLAGGICYMVQVAYTLLLAIEVLRFWEVTTKRLTDPSVAHNLQHRHSRWWVASYYAHWVLEASYIRELRYRLVVVLCIPPQVDPYDERNSYALRIDLRNTLDGMIDYDRRRVLMVSTL